MAAIKALEFLSPGILTSIQDLGRYGYGRYGVAPSGALDSYALRIANLLVGNSEDQACLETCSLKKTGSPSRCGARMLFKGMMCCPLPMPSAACGPILLLGAVSNCRASWTAGQLTLRPVLEVTGAARLSRAIFCWRVIHRLD